MPELRSSPPAFSGAMAATLALSLLGLFPGPSWADDGDPYMGVTTGVRCRQGKCGVAAGSNARPASEGRPKKASSPPVSSGAGNGGLKEPPTIESDGWEYDLGNGMGILPRFDGDKAKPRGRDAEPKPDPAVVAQQVVRELVLPDPVIRTNPDQKHAQLVRVPTWMWLDPAMWRPVSKTAKVPGVSVTATAMPRSASWRMGDGETEVCEGSGTPYSSNFAADSSSPDCGHTYVRSSMHCGWTTHTPCR